MPGHPARERCRGLDGRLSSTPPKGGSPRSATARRRQPGQRPSAADPVPPSGCRQKPMGPDAHTRTAARVKAGAQESLIQGARPLVIAAAACSDNAAAFPEQHRSFLAPAPTIEGRRRRSRSELPYVRTGPITTPQASRHATDRAVAPHTELLTLGSDPARFQTEPPACYRASWQLPGPDFHRQATTSLRTRRSTMALRHGVTSCFGTPQEAVAIVGYSLGRRGLGFGGLIPRYRRPMWITA